MGVSGMTYLTKELETVRMLKEEMLRRRRRQALIEAVEQAEPRGVQGYLDLNTISLDWAAEVPA
jgi:hypothetical protein